MSEHTITEESLYDDRSNKRKKVSLSPYQTLGWRIFCVIVGLAALMLVGVVAWAILTYPSIEDIVALAGDDPNVDRLQLWREAKAEWVQQLVSVSQLALFGSLIPMLGTIAGYLLGQKAATGEENEVL